MNFGRNEIRHTTTKIILAGYTFEEYYTISGSYSICQEACSFDGFEIIKYTT